MDGLNQVTLMGNLTRDPELRYLTSGTALCKFGLAINRTWKDKDGGRKEKTTFVDVAIFGPQGESCAQYLAKGRQVMVVGRLELEEWEGKDGEPRKKLSVVAERAWFLGGKGEAKAQAGSLEDLAGEAKPGTQAPDDIPF